MHPKRKHGGGENAEMASTRMAYNGDKSRTSTIPAKWPSDGGGTTWPTKGHGSNKATGRAASVSNSGRGPKSVSRR
jgi:hypothetical protein